MRVVSGKKRGKKLETLNGDTVRPTTDKVKESVFNVIQFELSGASFLDLFAGSGQMGIEALSRGASKVTFVDINMSSINVINKNLVATSLFDNAEVVNTNALLFLKNVTDVFDIAFLDPPYKSDVLLDALFLIPKVMSKSGIIICEHPIDVILPDDVVDFKLTKMYKYGKIAISVFRRNISLV